MDELFAKFATATARATGHPLTFIICVVSVVLWAIAGPIFGFSETWQLVINTGTTIVTFLMVFLIQNTQNRDSEAMQTKIDELIRSSGAHDEFIGIETLSEKELDELHKKCEQEAKRSQSRLKKTEDERKSREARKAREEDGNA